uniref:Uncharacterized protein n=1 Tax=Fagus sylvatica TaxID=28930 RepID=A0A2N9IJU6_FAGSY
MALHHVRGCPRHRGNAANDCPHSGHLLVLAAMSFNRGCSCSWCWATRRAGFDGLVMVLGNDWQGLRDCWMDLRDKNGGFGYVLGNWGLSEVIKARRSRFVVGWVTKSI